MLEKDVGSCPANDFSSENRHRGEAIGFLKTVPEQESGWEKITRDR